MNQSFDLSPFEKHSKDEWAKKVTSELKDDNSTDSLKWQHEKGMPIEPIYFEEDSPISTFQNLKEGINNDWANLSSIDCFSGELKNNVTTVSNFCDGFQLDCKNEFQLPRDMGAVFESKKQTHFKNLNPETLKNIGPIMSADHFGTLGMHPLKASSSLSDAKSDVIQVLESKNTFFQKFSSIIIPGNEFVDLGASISQEIGISLALFVEYYELLGIVGVAKDAIASEIELSTSIGQDFFHEIAKLRAYRNLIVAIQNSFGIEQFRTRINTSTSLRYKTCIESNNNLIRNTVEGLAAVISGCDSLCIHPTDDTSSTRRTALNVSNLLKEEAFLGRVVDPSAGSYYIEKLTEIISEQGWLFFQAIEKQGGYLQAMSKGWIDEQISLNREWLIERVEDSSIKLVNVNKHKKEMDSQDSNLFESEIFRLATTQEKKSK